MAGYNSRFLYEQCSFDQNLKLSVEPCKYHFILDKYENDNIGIGKIVCQNVDSDLSESINNVSRCKPININSNANIDAKWQTIGYRTDIENSLLAIDRPYTKCMFKQYHNNNNPKDIINKYVLDDAETLNNCSKKFYSKYSDQNLILVNTKLGDRYIVPTNNKMPKSNGYV